MEQRTITEVEKQYLAKEAARIIININNQIDQLQEMIKDCWEIKRKTMAQIKEIGIEYETIQEIIYQEKRQ